MTDDNVLSARNAVARAVRAGELVRQPCRRCGAPKAVARHEDYSKPLDVTWLCYKCHTARHPERADFKPRPQRRSLNLVLPLEILEGVAAAAAKRNQSRAKMIEIVLRDWLRDQEEAA